MEEENPRWENGKERRMRSTTKVLGLSVGTMVFTGSAMASVGGTWPSEPGYIYTSTSAADLSAAGFDDLTENGHLQIVPSWCGGCYTNDAIATGGSLMAFIEIDVTYAPADVGYGFYVTMNIDYTNPSFQFEDFEAIIEAADSDIDVMRASDAGTDWSNFDDWIEDPDVTVFQWNPAEFDGSSSNPFETTTLTFGYNFSGYSGLAGGNPFDGLVIGDIGAVPVPGALALLGLAGIASRRRRK